MTTREIKFDNQFFFRLAAELIRMLYDEHVQTTYPTLIEYIQTGMKTGMDSAFDLFSQKRNH